MHKNAYFIKTCPRKTKSFAKSRIILQKEGSFFQFDLKLGGLVGWVICFYSSRSFLIFWSSLNRHDSWSQVLLKALGSRPHFWNHCSPVRGYFVGSFRFFCRPLLIGKRRILRLCFLSRISNRRSHFALSRKEVWGSYGRGVVYIFSFPQLTRSLNPSSIKGFIPSLGVVDMAHSWKLYP